MMEKMKHERERQTIRDTNKMGKYKLRVKREREHRAERGGEVSQTDKLCSSPRSNQMS